MTIIKHEVKMNRKALIVWTSCIGFICFGCLVLFEGLKESMEEMAGAYAQMGSFSAAFGMNKVNVGTIEGFYAAEIALILSIGGAMYAAMTGVSMLAKEKEGHTSEFLYTLPIGRVRILGEKYAAMCILIILFNGICFLWILAGFAVAKEMPPGKEFFIFHAAQILMHLTVGSACFLLSAFSKRKQTGAALGFAVLLYVIDLLCRMIPDLEKLKYVTPYYFSNAADIFTEGKINGQMAVIYGGVIVVCAVVAVMVYRRRDL